MRNKTFWEIIFLAIVSFPALHYLSISINSTNESFFHQYFDVASIVAPIVFFTIAIFVKVFEKQPNV